MRAERIVGIALLLIGGGLGAFAANTAANRQAAFQIVTELSPVWHQLTSAR